MPDFPHISLSWGDLPEKIMLNNTVPWKQQVAVRPM